MGTLQKKMGLAILPPKERIYEDPTAKNLKDVLKMEQTYDMVKYVCSHDGLALKYVSKKLVSLEICEIAVEQNGYALKDVPETVIKSGGEEWFTNLCRTAVSSNIMAFSLVPMKYIDYEMAETVVANMKDSDEARSFTFINYIIDYIPENIWTEKLAIKSVERIPMSIKNIPIKKRTKKVSRIAVFGNWRALQFIPHRCFDEAIIANAISQDVMAIQFLTEALLNKELCEDCFNKNPAILSYLPVRYITKEMCIELVKRDRLTVWQLSSESKLQLYGDENIDLVLFDDIPYKYQNDIDFLNTIIEKKTYGAYSLLCWNDHLKERIKESGHYNVNNKRHVEIRPFTKKTVEYLQSKSVAPKTRVDNGEDGAPSDCIDLPITFDDYRLPIRGDIPKEYELISNNDSMPITHDYSEIESNNCTFFYVSDIHIDHHIINEFCEMELKSKKERNELIKEFIRRKVLELIVDANDKNDILLIGGDVSFSVDLSKIFYQELYRQWRGGLIISVLGNHELWDGTIQEEWDDPSFVSRPVEEIVLDYRSVIERGKTAETRVEGVYDTSIPRVGRYIESILLENELYIQYKGRFSKILTEKDIDEADDDELIDILADSSFSVLGGLGYSGLDPLHNAVRNKIYRKAVVSVEDDKKRSERFNRIYDKVRRCAKNRKVIVLTHTPVYDWTAEEYNPGWIYVNGHTHMNSIIKREDGTAVLSDNQIGYKSKIWKLNSFVIDKIWYDPFKNYGDGIYEISSDQFRDFSRGRGIFANGCGYSGQLYMIKRNDMYMFVLRSPRSLCLMAGGQRKKLMNTDIQYYYNNMLKYGECIKRIIKPYQLVLQRVSDEVKKIGGTGLIHGCIVDISWFSHIYVNPYDGKITYYWALSKTLKFPFDTLQGLLEKAEPRLLDRYKEAKEGNRILMISQDDTDEIAIKEDSIIPQWMLGTEIYEPSRILRSIQYVWEQNVIRVWNDAVLESYDIGNKAIGEVELCLIDSNL